MHEQKDLLGKLDKGSQSTLSSWETGKTEPSAADVAMLARACGCSADYLLGLSDFRTVPPRGMYLVDVALYEALLSGKRRLAFGQRWASAVPDGEIDYWSPKEVEDREAKLPPNYRKR